MAHLHARKLSGTITGSGWTDTGTAGAGSSQSSTLSGTRLTLAAVSAVAEEAKASITSAAADDLRCSVLQFNLASLTGDSGALFQVETDFGSSNRVTFLVTIGGNVVGRKTEGGSDTAVWTAAYNSSTHAFLRFRYFDTTIFYDFSADALTWTNGGSSTLSFTPSSGTTLIEMGAENGADATAIVDYVNVPFAPLLLARTADTTTAAPGRTGNGDITVSFPTNYVPVAGDFALIPLYHDQGDGSTPTNYAEISGSPFGSATPKLCVFTYTFAGGESAPVTTISGSGTNISHCAGNLIYWGVSQVGTIGTASAGTGSPMTAGGITTVAPASWVVGLCGRGDNETSSGQTLNASSTGVSEILDAGTDQGNDSQVSAYHKFIAAAGATGNGSATTSATDPYVSVLLELQGIPYRAAGSVAVALSLSGTGEVTAAGAVTGTGDVSIGSSISLTGQGLAGNKGSGDVAVAITLNGTGQQQISGAGDVAVTLTLASQGIAGNIGSGDVAVSLSLAGTGQQAHSGSGGVSVALSLDGSGLRGNTGTGDVSVTLTLEGTCQQSHTGTGDVPISLTLSGTGTTVDNNGITGTGDVSLTLALDGSGQQEHSGSGDVAVTLTLNGTAALEITGSGGVTIALTCSGSSQQEHAGSGDCSVTLTLDGTGQQSHTGSGDVSVAPTLSGTGQQEHSGSGDLALTLTLDGTATTVFVYTGSGDVSLSLTIEGTGASVGGSTPGEGKYAPEHASALADLGAATGFASDHASALADLRNATGFSRDHASALKDLRKAGI